MKVNKVAAKIIIPTIIIFNNFVSFHFWHYEIILIKRK